MVSVGLIVVSKLDNLRLAAVENFDWKGWEGWEAMMREGKTGGKRKISSV